MDYVIDRFEGKFAVCQNIIDEKIINVERDLISGNVSEGDVVTFKDGKYFFNEEITNERKNIIKRKFDSLWN